MKTRVLVSAAVIALFLAFRAEAHEAVSAPHPRGSIEITWQLDPESITQLTIQCDQDAPVCRGKRVTNKVILKEQSFSWEKARPAFEEFERSRTLKLAEHRKQFEGGRKYDFLWTFSYGEQSARGGFSSDQNDMIRDPASNLEAHVSDLIDLN